MLSELGEKDATGRIAEIFGEIRHLWGVPYVSAIHRHMATCPGLLEWAWEAVGEAFRTGRAQQAGLAAASELPIPPLDAIPPHALRLWNVPVEANSEIIALCRGFERVAPINMMFAGLTRACLEAAGAGSMVADSDGHRVQAKPIHPLPPPLPAPPPLVDLEHADPSLKAAVLTLATVTEGRPFVPGLYRMLAHWPAFAAHIATVLAPRLQSPATLAAANELRRRIDQAVGDMLPELDRPQSASGRPHGEERRQFLRVLETYRKTSPEMVLFGGLIRRALPD